MPLAQFLSMICVGTGESQSQRMTMDQPDDNSLSIKLSQPGMASQHSNRRWCFSIVSISASILIVSFAGDSMRLNSIHAALAHLRGETAIVERIESRRGDENGTPQTTATVQIRNVGWNALTIRGARTDCTCAVVSGIPTTVAGGAVAEVTIRISSRAGMAARQRIVLFFDGVDSPLEFGVGNDATNLSTGT